jgi:hypothetical protein
MLGLLSVVEMFKEEEGVRKANALGKSTHAFTHT